MLRVFGLLYLLIISSTYALDCGEKESWDLRLDQGNGPFSDGKVYHQGGTGTCYAQSLALNLKAQLKDRQDISAFHLAAFKADSPNSFFENFFSSNNKKHVYLKNNELISSIDAGEFCETFEKAKKMQESGICPQSKSVLENSFNFVSSETARSDLAQLSLFFDEISEKKLKVSDLKENLSGFLNPLLDSTSCRERIFGEAISASKLLIYVRGVFNKKLKTDIENNAKYKKRLDNLNSERFYNKFNGKQIKDIDPAYVYDKLVELDIVKKEEQDKDKFVADFRPLFDIYKLNEDSTCRKERSRNRIASIENSGCFKKYNGASASISKAVGALNNLYQDIGKVVLHLDFENKKFPDYFMSLISECSKNDRVSIPDKLKCENVNF